MIQYHVTSLDLSKQLYEAGIKIDSEFWWVLDMNKRSNLYSKEDIVNYEYKLGNGDVGLYPAPLSSELGELMPSEWHDKERNTFCQVQLRKIDGWVIDIHNGNMGFSGDELPNLCAKMLLYLKEKGLLL